MPAKILIGGEHAGRAARTATIQTFRVIAPVEGDSARLADSGL